MSEVVELEEWCAIEGWPDYQVSNLGRVRSVRKWARGNRPPRVLKPWRCGPYVAVALKRDGTKEWKVCVHHLVCVAFHGPKPISSERIEVAHGDGNPHNNVASNLRWATCAENNADKKLHGTYQCGAQASNAKLTDEDVRKIRELAASGLCDKDIAAKFGITSFTVSSIRRGETWTWLIGNEPPIAPGTIGSMQGKHDGPRLGNRKLTDQQVLDIRAATNCSQKELAGTVLRNDYHYFIHSSRKNLETPITCRSYSGSGVIHFQHKLELFEHDAYDASRHCEDMACPERFWIFCCYQSTEST